jgi:hypothetical protein
MPSNYYEIKDDLERKEHRGSIVASFVFGCALYASTWATGAPDWASVGFATTAYVQMRILTR